MGNKAGIDFTHCKRGYCKSCHPVQRRKCEQELDRLEAPSGKEGRELASLDRVKESVN